MTSEKEKIGEGYYYNVYALDSARVVKENTSQVSKIKKLFLWYWHKPFTFIKAVAFLTGDTEHSITRSRVISEISEFHGLLGNPQFINAYEYKQDRAKPLIQILDSLTAVEFENHIKDYVNIVFKLWSYGYGDQVYNFTLNTGISLITNKLILIDFNELTTKKERIVTDIETDKWLNQASMTRLQLSHHHLWVIADDLLNKFFTIENLNKKWKIK